MSLKLYKLEMESSSSFAMLLVVEVKDKNRLVLKKHPYKSMVDDPIGAFFSIPHGVMHVDDVRAYIHCEIEETDTKEILDLYTDNIRDEIGNSKLEFMQLQRKGFTQFMNFVSFEEKEWVRYVPSRIHHEFIWLDQPYKITPEAIKIVTCLHQIGVKPRLRKVTNPMVTMLTSAKFDGRSMKINTIKDDDVKFAAMVIGLRCISLTV